MADTAGTAGPGISAESPVTSDDIAALSDAGADSSPAQPVAPVSPAPATAAPGADGTTVPETPQGPIPFDRHQSILENARTKARQEAEKEFRQKYGWADRYQPQQVEQSTRLYQWLSENPKAFLSYLKAQVGDEGPAQAPARAEEPPQPDLRAEDGTPVYSAPQLQKLQAWERRQYDERLEKLQKRLDEQDRVAQMRQIAVDAKASASQLLAQARSTWPLFADLQPDVLEAMRQDPALNLHDAYIRVFSEKGQERLKNQWQQEYTGTLATKQSASTPPPGKPSGTPKKYIDMDVRELVEQEYAALSRKR